MALPMALMQAIMQNPELVASALAAKGVSPQQVAQLQGGAQSNGIQLTPGFNNTQPQPGGGVSVQDYEAQGMDPFEFQMDHLTPAPPAGGYRGPIGASGLPGHTAPQGPAGLPAAPPASAPAVGAQQQQDELPMEGMMALGDVLAGMRTPSSSQMPRAPVVAPMGNSMSQSNILQLMQWLAAGRQAPGAQPPLGQVMGG